MNEQRTIEIAKVIADNLGDQFDLIPYDKAEWIRTRGGETFRDVNLPFQRDYLQAARAVVELLNARPIVITGEWGKSHVEPAPFGRGIGGQRIVK